MISLVQASTATPENKFSTTEMVASMMHKLSPELINTICSLGVENRYSAIENYADFLNGAPINLTSSTTDLGVNATRKCIEEWGGDPSQIGLLVAATNTPDQVLPCLASEVMGRTHGLLPRSLSTVSMQSQGCSVMLKSVEVAQWYLAANPGKMAMVLMSEAHTPLAGAPVRALKLPNDSALVTILRGGRVIIPQADDSLEAGDELLFVATSAVEEEIRAALGH